MKRIIILAAIALLGIGGQVFAQEKDSYRQKVETYMFQGSEIRDMEKQIRESIQQNIPAEALTNDSLRPMVEYLQNGLLNDLIDRYEVSMRKYVSEAELDELIEWSQKAETQSVKAKEKSLATRIQSQDPGVLVHIGALVNGMTAVLQGQEPDRLPKSQKSASYQAAFHAYYEASNVGATLRQTYDGILNTFGQYMQGQPGAEEAIRTASNYMVENLEPLMLLLYEDVYTEEDLEYYTSFCRTTAYQHNAQAGADFAGNISDLLINMLSKIGIK